MVFVDHLGVVQQAPDQGALAVVDVTTGQEAQQFLAFVLGQVGEDVLADQFGLVRHGLTLT
jgi:ABC-type molybdate transport system substrate-binding protein